MTTTRAVSKIFVGGAWVDSDDSLDPIPVTDPATETTFAYVTSASARDTARAVDAARRAFDDGPWSRLSPRERARYLLRMAEIIEERKPEILELLVAEAGCVESSVEAMQYRTCMEHFVDMAERVVAGHLPVNGVPPIITSRVGQGVVVDDPAGVAALITAYNFPFHLNLMKLGPALGAGCTAVLKPSELTPLTGLILGEIAEAAELPAGVLNVVTGGPAVGEELTTNIGVDVVSFTGSGTVGKAIVRQCAATLKRVVLELGGKSASIVFEDADLDGAAQAVVGNMTRHCGQGCIFQTRTLVQQSIHDELVSRVMGLLANVRVGDTRDPATVMGPLISSAQRERVLGYVESGRNEGAVVAAGGGVPAEPGHGFYVEPTLFVDCDNSMKIAQEEIFGPVGAVISFRDTDEAVRIANDTRYGLGAGVWSRDPVRAYEVARRMRAGSIQVNGGAGGVSPFGPYGGFKESGLGREFGEFGFRAFIEQKFIGWPAITG